MSNFLIGTDPTLRKTKIPTVTTLTAGVGFTAGTSTAITLGADPGDEKNVIVTMDGVTQHRSGYSVSGTTLTFDAAIPTGTAEIEATFGVPVSSVTVADDAVTLAKMASGTDGNIISYDASGNPVAIATGTDGQVLTSTGAGSPPAFEAAGGGGLIEAPGVFTSTGTYTKNASAARIVVWVIGGGGGGAGAQGDGSNYASGSGGGGGGCSMKTIENGSVGSTETVTIGAAGAAGAGAAGTGGTGGTSSFGSHATATGGVGGITADAGEVSTGQGGGKGGLGASGDLNFGGSCGHYASAVLAGVERTIGAGGSSFMGGGGNAGPAINQQTGVDGQPYGGGGSGGGSTGSNTNAGGAGAAGVVVVWEYA